MSQYLQDFIKVTYCPKNLMLTKKGSSSSLIMSSQISREAAINDLKKKPHNSEIQLEEDKEYFLKKMNWSEWRLDEYISRQRIEHDKYGSERKSYEILLKIKNKYLWIFKMTCY